MMMQVGLPLPEAHVVLEGEEVEEHVQQPDGLRRGVGVGLGLGLGVGLGFGLGLRVWS